MLETFEANENESGIYRALITKENGDPLPAGDIVTLTATLYKKATGEIINGRNKQNVLNVNGGSVDAEGNFALQLTVLDNQILDEDVVGREVHILLLEWTRGENLGGNKEIKIAVKNLAKVP